MSFDGLMTSEYDELIDAMVHDVLTNESGGSAASNHTADRVARATSDDNDPATKDKGHVTGARGEDDAGSTGVQDATRRNDAQQDEAAHVRSAERYGEPASGSNAEESDSRARRGGRAGTEADDQAAELDDRWASRFAARNDEPAAPDALHSSDQVDNGDRSTYQEPRNGAHSGLEGTGPRAFFERISAAMRGAMSGAAPHDGEGNTERVDAAGQAVPLDDMSALAAEEQVRALGVATPGPCMPCAPVLALEVSAHASAVLEQTFTSTYCTRMCSSMR